MYVKMNRSFFGAKPKYTFQVFIDADICATVGHAENPMFARQFGQASMVGVLRQLRLRSEHVLGLQVPVAEKFMTKRSKVRYFKIVAR